MKGKIFIGMSIVVCFIFLGSGCSTKSLYISQYNGSLTEGIVYFLPKRVLKLTITYTARQKIKVEHAYETEIGTRTVVIKEPVELETLLIPDQENAFVITGKDISDDVFLESGFYIELDDYGHLHSISSEVSSKALDVAKGIVTSGIKIAKLVAVAGEEEEEKPEVIKKIFTAITKAYNDLEVLTNDLSYEKLKELEKLAGLIENLHNMVEDYQYENKEYYKETEYTYTTILDPGTFKKKEKGSVSVYEHIVKPKFNLAKDLSPIGLPPLRVVLEIPAQEFDSIKKIDPGQKKRGIIYRIPVPALTRIFANVENTQIFSDYISFPQFGPMAIAMVGSTKGLKNRRTRIKFSSETGGLLVYDASSESSAVKMVKGLEESISSLQEAILELKYDLKRQEIEKKAELLEAEQWLIDAKKELEELKKEK